MRSSDTTSKTNLGLNGFSAHGTATVLGDLGLVNGAVHCSKTLEALLEFGGETVVGFNLRCEQGVTSNVRLDSTP